MRTAIALALSSTLVLVACGGDDQPADPDAAPPDAPPGARCEPTPPALVEGPMGDPLALPLPVGCVTGGMRDAPGRWFVRDGGSNFNFLYPKITGDCDQGFRRANVNPDDLDPTDDGYATHQWSDGTRFMQRTYYRFPETGDPQYEYVSVFAACMLADGTLAGLEGTYDTDTGEAFAQMPGHRFGPRTETSTPLHLVGELGTDLNGDPIIAYNVFIDGTHAYTVGPRGFDVIDIADPAAPVAVAHLAGQFNDVKVVRGAGKVVAYLSPLRNDNTSVIDVTNPAAPVAQTQISEYSHSVFLQTVGAQTLLYLATYTDKVPVFNVNNPVAPVRLGEASVPGPIAGVHDLFAAGNMIYANNTTEGMVAFDVSGGLDSAVERGRIPTSYSHASFAGTAGGRPIVLHGDEGMTPNDGGAFLRILEGDPTSPSFISGELGRYQTRPEVGIHNFLLLGDLVYIAYYHDGVRVVDVSNAAQPTEVAHYNTWNDDTAPGGPFESALGIRLANGLIYVADSMRGLIILELQKI
jgi:hypothetical protein